MHADTPDTRRAYTRRIFSVVAPRYPLVTRLLSFFRDAAWKRRLVDALQPLHEGIVLDIACGPGDITIACKKRYPGATVIGADLSAPMLASFPPRERASIILTRQDMGTLAVRAGSVDILTGGYALRNAPDLPAAVAEISRIVKPGGTAAFLDFSRSQNRFAAAVAIALLSLWGSFWGLLLHGNPRIYGYIAKSLSRFPDRAGLRRLFQAGGFIETYSRRQMFGMIEIVVFRKGGSP
jgi:demethylmenaquinone methyltransferase/2-methoxy-6-polyprenyl-1,4-benzoquinol methylase